MLGLTYLGGAVVHLWFWATDRSVYADITEYVQFDWYRAIWADLVVPNLGFLLPVLAVLELGIGLAICSSGRRVRFGQAVGAAFTLAVAPLGFWWPSNVALAVVHGLLLRRDFPDPVIRPLDRDQLPTRDD